TLRVEGDLQKSAQVWRYFATGEETQLIGEECDAVLRTRLSLPEHGIRRLQHEGQRRHQVQEQVLIAGRAARRDRVTAAAEDVSVHLERPAHRRELGIVGVAGATGESRLPSKTRRRRV